MEITRDGWVTDKKIIQEPRKLLEHGNIAIINAIVLHRTGSNTAKSVLSAWKSKKEGTHFLISETGDIYQTVSLNKNAGMLVSCIRDADQSEAVVQLTRRQLNQYYIKRMLAGAKNSDS